MKKIITYVSPTRVRRLITKLMSPAVREIKVVAYFKPLSQVSRIELLCEEGAVERVVRIIHEVAPIGGIPDHLIFVRDFKPKPFNEAIISRRMGLLDE